MMNTDGEDKHPLVQLTFNLDLAVGSEYLGCYCCRMILKVRRRAVKEESQ